MPSGLRELTATDPFELTAQLVDVASESFAEAPLVEMIERRLSSASHLELTRLGDNLVARTTGTNPHRVVLGGHTDTVPANGNASARIEGDTLWGVGSADMKGGLAVMILLAEWFAEAPVELTYVFYAREEVAAEQSGLGELARLRPDLIEGDVAILGEPTDGDVEAGCQGALRLRVTLAGERAHLARAWMGRNAIHRLGALLEAMADYVPRQPEILGCRYHEALQAVKVDGGVAGNVVPDSAVVEIGHRFAPDRNGAEAEAHVREFLAPHLEPGDTVELVDLSEAAMPAVDHPFVAAMVERNALEVRAKLGWTDVARFSALGVPAVNLGPGDPTLAHTAEEHVRRQSIERSFDALRLAITAGF